LENLARNVDTLILWLDCDREGENICFEVVNVVTSVNRNVNILRAKFSALTRNDIFGALNSLEYPNKNLSDAVDIRQKIDLMIGASFTRLQSIAFRRMFNLDPNQKSVISYGPCQFPTLNFIVERTEKIRNFVSEEFYYIDLSLEKVPGMEVKFRWDRDRLFDKVITLTIYEKIIEAEKGKIIKVDCKPSTRLRPIPLNTVEMQKLVSKKLRINSHKAMEVAEKLYQKGFISYPRTETQIFSRNMNLQKFVEDQKASSNWGQYASNLLENGRYTYPRCGKLDDKAHPPIHPVKFADPNSLDSEEERKIYELLVRHFLASVSPDAKGQETQVQFFIADELFHAKGLRVTDQGYLEIYIYDKWNDAYMAEFMVNEIVIPSKCFFETGNTTPPNFLSESELISLMDKEGIGTDATIAEHIKTIQER
jgi:DNA topoisomerase-3